jgi:hypothetical protein
MSGEYNNADVGGIVENEGLGYAVQHYTSHTAIKDQEVAQRWKAAADAMNELERYLRDEAGVIE